ncbi:MAG: hypothetical protein ACYTFQ_26795, partial [Planctomycetota bacterium]
MPDKQNPPRRDFGTPGETDEITAALASVYNKVGTVLGEKPLRPILEVVRGEECEAGSRNGGYLVGCFTEQEWEIIRFAI